jgi:1-deoxy-D-xylulose-5-phosphate reductoisomerase
MADSVKKLVILGSTGSIGQQTLDIVRKFPDKYRVLALAAGNNLELLDRQVSEFTPKFVYHLGKQPVSIMGGSRSMSVDEMAGLPEADLIVIALSGNAGIIPTHTAVSQGKTVALANKESLVAAGALITAKASVSGATILPVDSEHSAIWQCLVGENCPPHRLILTASGGPFRHFSKEQLTRVTPEQALHHPSWHMGKKVTIDSATLMNKGLEVIEAHWLFSIPFERISVIIHPQSIIHSMVEFKDGAIKAQLGCPDMRLPIQYALSYPERLTNEDIPRLDLATLKLLVFEEPDLNLFPCFNLAVEAGRKGGTYPAALSAADECAVNLFLDGHIKFTEVSTLVEQVLSELTPVSDPTIEDILAVGDRVRQTILQKYTGDHRWQY